MNFRLTGNSALNVTCAGRLTTEAMNRCTHKATQPAYDVTLATGLDARFTLIETHPPRSLVY